MAEKGRRPAELRLGYDLPSLTETNGRNRSVDVHKLLRAMIVNGRIPPGTILSQQGLSRELNVSRTPIREALRKLQEEELIEGRPNYRARVTPFSYSQLEAIFTARIFMEPLAVSLAVPQFKREHHQQLTRHVGMLGSKRAKSDFAYWVKTHRRFHLLLAAGTSPLLLSKIEANCERSDRYLDLFHDKHPPGWWMSGLDEHKEIVEICKDGDSAKILRVIALHIGRTALDLASQLAPKTKPEYLLKALEIMLHAGSDALGLEEGTAHGVLMRRILDERSTC